MDPSQDNNDAVSTAIEKYSDMVRRICFLYLKDRADIEDVFQEVFIKLFLHKVPFESEQHQKAWICRVTFNKCKDMCKSFWHRRVVSIEDTEIPYENPEQAELLDAVLKLPPDHRQVIYLHYYEGRSIPEIAGLMNKKLNTAYTLLGRAKERLRKRVGDI